MYASMWSYPWDYVDIGMDNALDELQSIGLNDVSLITSYHAGRFLQIRSPKRKAYFPQDGVLYYNADPENFKHLRIKPKVGEFAKDHPDFFHELTQKSKNRGMTVSGWTVCLHNTRIGYEYPEVCVHNAFGDTVYYNQCPANEHVRQYILALLADIDQNLPLCSIQLESMNYMGFAHEYHHEKDGVGISAYEDFLLSLCFCRSCMQAGNAAGIDMTAVQEYVKEQICECLNSDRKEIQSCRFSSEGLSFFKDNPEMLAYLKQRSRTVTSLMAEARKHVHHSQLYFLSLLTNLDSWLFGVDLVEISKFCDGVVICSYDCDEEKAAGDVYTSRGVFNPGTKIITGMRAFYPEYANGDQFVSKVQSVLNESRDGFIFYNYGLIPKKQLEWVARAMEVTKR